ncbi:TetR/AcrR family transcriptional regulator [Streptomonospora nanhaiensis]|uniref:AcrR family transcriptional regulator n=1 Tax=Streptomonospora nanhaiensis TaxID=1323731 RepID=A0A853BLS3_9ACTN|nr:TetR/AcrR family transcriptional regulator [Streptomonospora nanhaiensis]MBV2363093.1 TetR/AcrR family transcriptional regulator [Streptomonospora nanhaiensis]MBX9391834.1 TetR/AcrR family transcriptional regulator [Streptomonospora nanhaiensis]NYI95462.1 AcrR family transcriptional regulator [Streptomonospora nanhaiensis]
MTWHAQDSPDRPAPEAAVDEREARAERILAAAGELLVSLGYRRVTVEDVARRADIGKGTVYLHFRTKELLFLSVVMRAQADMVRRIVDGVRADPLQVRPSHLARTSYLLVHEDPVLRAVLLGDPDTLGSLARGGARHLRGLMDLRRDTMRDYFAVLSDHGVLRGDLPLDSQLMLYLHVFTGYFLAEPLTTVFFPDPGPVAERADLLAHALRTSLEAAPDDPGPARAAAPHVVAVFDRVLAALRTELANQKLT